MIQEMSKRQKKELRNLITKTEKISAAMETEIDHKKKESLKIQFYDVTARTVQLYQDQEEFDKAKELYKSLPWNSHGEHRYNSIARELIAEKKYDDSRNLLEEALTKYPESSMLVNSMGLMFFKACNQHEALKCFDHALALADDDSASIILFNKVRSLRSLGYYEEANRIVMQNPKIPGHPRHLIEKGNRHLDRSEPWLAIYYYQMAMQEGYKSADVYINLCDCYLLTGILHEAYALAREGVENIPDNADMYENYAKAATMLGELEEAIEIIENGLKLNIEHAGLKKLQQHVNSNLGYE